jgi:hypothetical protein
MKLLIANALPVERVLSIHMCETDGRNIRPGARNNSALDTCRALEVVLAHSLHLGRRRPNAQELPTLQKQVEAWQRSELTDVAAKVVISEAFVDGKLEAPRRTQQRTHVRAVLSNAEAGGEGVRDIQ